MHDKVCSLRYSNSDVFFFFFFFFCCCFVLFISYDKKAKNFIGRSFYLLRTVPVGGEEKTLTLYSHSGKHQRGQVKLRLNVLGLEDSTPPDVAHRDHKMLFKALVDHDSKLVSTL